MKAPLFLLTVCVAAFARCGCAAENGGADVSSTMAVVEGVAIKEKDVARAFAILMRGSGKKLSDLGEAEKAKALRAVLDGLVQRQLVKNRSAGVKISEAEVERQYDKLVEQASGAAKLAEQLAAAGMNENDLKEQIREELRAQKWLADRLFGQGDATEEQAKMYYDMHLNEFDASEEVRASYIAVAVPPGTDPLVQARKLKIIRDAAERIGKGEDFGKLAAEVSEDKRNSNQGGDLGYLPKTARPADLIKALFALKDGEVSKVLTTQQGFYLIKRTGYKEPHKETFEEAKARIMDFLTRKNQMELRTKLLAEIRAAADVKIYLPAGAQDQGSQGAPAEK